MVPVHSGADLVLPPWPAYYGDETEKRKFLFAVSFIKKEIMRVRVKLLKP